MAGASEQHEAATEAASTTVDATTAAPTSPAQSDKSSDSEGKPVREKLKETRIDAQGTKDSAPPSDQVMNDVPNGNAKAGSRSASGSDTERGRLRRKRSREDFEQDDLDKQPEKKLEHDKTERHHTRKRSRDIKDIENGPPFKPAANPVSRIEENDAEMISPAKTKSCNSESAPGSDSSPKNKRTREQAETADEDATKAPIANGKPASDIKEEREPKRPRDEDGGHSTDATTQSKSKIPPSSGFANTSSTSPFASTSPKPQGSKTSDRPELLPQTSEDKFKASGFGSFASSAKSPFGGLKSPDAGSPFGAAAGTKLSSFASSTASSTSTSTGGGFAALGGASKSSFGATTFGSSLGGGFGGLSGAKPGLSSFATPSDLTIKGLKSKPSAFGTPGEQEKSDESDDDDAGDDDENEKDGNVDDERKSSQPLLSQQPHETGEEGEHNVWNGRAKLYTMVGEGSTKGWKERGVGTFKLNITVEEPKKARFVLRADGTHRLILNAAVTKQLKFGGDSNGEKPKDGRLLFNSATPSGELEMHLLKLRAERAVELWEEVAKVQETEL